jgi:RND superfamily putative drug exporter
MFGDRRNYTMTRLRWLLPALVLLLWLAGAGPLQSLGAGLTELQENDTAAFLPDSAESTRVAELQAGFQEAQFIPAVLLWEAPGGIDQQTLGAIGERVAEAAAVADEAGALAAQPSTARRCRSSCR